MSCNVHGTFVSEKINKIRWRPDFMGESQCFLTGSWDNDRNSVKLWNFHVNEDEQLDEEDSDVYPFLIAETPHQGDVTEAQFLNTDYFVTSSSHGAVRLNKLSLEHGADLQISCQAKWEQIHSFPNKDRASCTAFAVNDNDIVSVGEDGSINLLNSQENGPVRKIENADSCSIHCVTFLKHNEVVTSNLRGQMKVWDLRSSSQEPCGMFINDQVPATCLVYHPTQRHLVVAGDEEGSLTIWDLRHNAFPINLLNAHESSVSEIQFHPDHPNQLFSCSSSGDIWHWSPKNSALSSSTTTDSNNVWLASDTVKSKLEVFTLMPKLHKPINSIDLNQNKVVCGCDNEAVYLINGVNVFK